MEQQNSVRIAVYVRGGNVQDVISNCDGVEVVIVDYDNEKCTEKPDREFVPVRRDERLLARTTDASESE